MGLHPTSWLQRVPVATLALLGFLVARYIAAYQLGHIDGVWEPFFAGEAEMNGTETIITSPMSKAWPVADAGLGAVVYALEIVMTFMGGKDRWRTMSWMVLALAFLILPADCHRHMVHAVPDCGLGHGVDDPLFAG